MAYSDTWLGYFALLGYFYLFQLDEEVEQEESTDQSQYSAKGESQKEAFILFLFLQKP